LTVFVPIVTILWGLKHGRNISLGVKMFRNRLKNGIKRHEKVKYIIKM